MRAIVAVLLLTLNACAIQRQSQAPNGDGPSRSSDTAAAIGPASADRAPQRSGGCAICAGEE